MAVYTDWPALQFGFFDSVDDKLVACGNAMTCRLETPIDTLSDDGWDRALDLAQKQLREGTKPNIGCASATINPLYQGAGLADCWFARCASRRPPRHQPHGGPGTPQPQERLPADSDDPV